MREKAGALALVVFLDFGAIHSAMARGDEHLWKGVVAVVCIEQDTSLKRTRLGESMIRSAEYQKWRASVGEESLRCIRDRQLLSAKLCRTVLENSPELNSEKSVELYREHVQEIVSLESLQSCSK